MKNDAVKYGLLGILAGGALVWFAVTSAVNSNNNSMINMMGIRSNTPLVADRDTNLIDRHFIEQMIPHHEDAITMSEVALTKAQHPELKELAQSIIESQTKEINQMKDWYEEWFGTTLPTGSEVMNQHGMMNGNGMHMGMMGDETDLNALENASDFDREFVEQMIPHHQMAVMMASMLKGGSDRPEMKKLADDIITTQSNEIDQMREWLRTW